MIFCPDQGNFLRCEHRVGWAVSCEDLILETWTLLEAFPILFQRNSPLKSSSRDGRPRTEETFWNLFIFLIWKWKSSPYTPPSAFGNHFSKRQRKQFEVSLFRMSKLNKWRILKNIICITQMHTDILVKGTSFWVITSKWTWFCHAKRPRGPHGWPQPRALLIPKF